MMKLKFYHFEKTIALFLVAFLTNLMCISASSAQQRLSIGDRHSLYSDILEQDRTILVGLPRDYTENKQYPVLYLLDGGRYHLMAQGVIDFLTNRAEEIPEIILVAIPNIYRNTDLTPAFNPTDPNARVIEYSGGANKFLDFFKHELKPFIEDRYSTSGNNVIFGHSAAGLFAAYAFLEEPELFDNYIVSDPSLWYGDNMLIKRLAANQLNYFSLKKTIYVTQIDRSNDEEDIMSEPQKRFSDLLNMLPNITSTMVLIPGESHSTVPLKSLYQGLTFIFDTKGDE